MTSVFATYEKKAYPYHFEGTLLVHTIAGGTPTDPKVAEGWLRTKLASNDDIIRAQVAEVMVERGLDVDAATEAVVADKHLQGFKRDDRGLYLDGRCLKSAIKEAANVRWPWPSKKWGPSGKASHSFWAEHVFVPEERLYLGVQAPSGVVQQFVRSRFGSAIQYQEYVEEAKVDFTVQTDYKFTPEEWALLWLTGEQQGLGASRSQGFGRYEVVRWEKAS